MSTLANKIDEVLTGNLRALKLDEYREAFKSGILDENTCVEKFSKNSKKYESWNLGQCLTWYLMHKELAIYLDMLSPRMTGIPEDGELLDTLKERERNLQNSRGSSRKYMKDLKLTEKVLKSFTPMRRIQMMLNTDTIDQVSILSILQDELEKQRVTEFLDELVKAICNAIFATKDSEKSSADYERFSVLCRTIDQKLIDNNNSTSFSNSVIRKIIQDQVTNETPIHQYTRFMGYIIRSCECDISDYLEWCGVDGLSRPKVRSFAIFITSLPQILPRTNRLKIEECVRYFTDAMKLPEHFASQCFVGRHHEKHSPKKWTKV